jgi:hypothetical protein
METIVKAAIIVEDVIYTGWRHCFIIHDYCKQTGKKSCPGTNWPEDEVSNQGFVTSEGRYVDRETALKIATVAKQVIVKHGCKHELYSEDLWNVNGIHYTVDSVKGLCEGKSL